MRRIGVLALIAWLGGLGTASTQTAFFASQVVTMESPRSVEGGMFEFLLTHRAELLIDESNLNNLFGFDSLLWVGFGLVWGVTDAWTVGIYRTVAEKNFEAWIRWTPGLTQQSSVHLSLRGSLNFNTEEAVNDPLRVGAQVIAGVDIGRLSLMVAPSLVTNPARFEAEEDWTVAVGMGAAIRVLETISVVGEVVPVVAGFRARDAAGKHHMSWGIAVQKEVGEGGHVFTILITNQVWTTLDRYLPGWVTSKPRLGFNLIRRF